MLVDPRLLDEVISVTDAMRVNWRSSGVATDEAMVSGLAPGKPACTEIVGKSTCGSGDTGKIRNATPPASAIATVSKVVATGRLMKTSEMFMTIPVGQVGNLQADCQSASRFADCRNVGQAGGRGAQWARP
jgi:hypothetical protein